MSLPGTAYAAALALAAVFAVAGVAKLRRRAATARAFAALGLASPGALAVGVPLAELALAGGLVLAPAEAGIATLAVLAGFTTFLLRSMNRGDALACGCFGSARAAPAGSAELVRNGVLAGAAAFTAFAASPARVVPGPGDVVLVAAVAAVALALMRAVGRRASVASPGGPEVGSVAPALPGLRYRDHQFTLVAFVAPTCEGCEELRRALARPGAAGHAVRLVELGDSSAGDFAAFGVRSAPYLVVVDVDGRVRAAGPARSPSDVAALTR